MDLNTINYLYDELQISLVVLSLPAYRQCEITGYGCVGDEILDDFDTYCIRNNSILKEHGLISDYQIELLNQFSVYVKKFDERDENFYWDKEVLRTHPDWEELRIKSRILLSQLFDEQYDVEIIREDSTTDGIRVERTIRKLVTI